MRRLALVPLAALAALGGPLLAPPAALAAPAPALSIRSLAVPGDFSSTVPSEGDRYTLLVENVGGARTIGRLTVTDRLPEGITVPVAAKFKATPDWECTHTAEEVTCTLPRSLASLQEAKIEIPVDVPASGPGSAGTLTNLAVVEEAGGRTVATSSTNAVDEPLPPFGVRAFAFSTFDAAGEADSQAAGHPNALTSSFAFDLPLFFNRSGQFEPGEDVKDVVVDLPLGFVGDPQAAARCSFTELAFGEEGGSSCPRASQVGTFSRLANETGGWAEIGSYLEELGKVHVTAQIYNMVPERGYPAEFALYARELGQKWVVLYATVVHTAAGYALQVRVPGLIRIAQLGGAQLTFYGDPAREDGLSGPEPPFFTNPAACTAAPLRVRFEADSWQRPGEWRNRESVAYPELGGCAALRFEPSIEARPTTDAADSPSGLDFHLQIPQSEGPEAPATPPLRKAVVALPSGLAANPSAAAGLAACAPTGPEGINIGSRRIGPAGQDLGDPEATELGAGHLGGNGSPYDDGLYHTAPGHCPAASQIGSVEVTTPLLEGTLPGRVYLGTPACDPCGAADAAAGRLLHLYIEVDDSKTGVIVKLAGTTTADPRTGRLTASFEQNPQLPFSDLKLQLKEGPRAPLRTPPTCGAYEATSQLTPWSAPQSGPPATPSGSYRIARSPVPGACPSIEAAEPNDPSFEAGTESPLAGAYSPFVLHLTRPDGSQEIKRIDLTLPPGLSGRLAGLTTCRDADLAAAAARSGAAELAAPSCPKGSEVGTVTVGAGAGPNPFYVTGHAYLAGPYAGAPLSLAIVTPALAGPFDLGTVVVRTALYVNPETAQITAKSDPIPSTLAGIPLDIRSISLRLDRPNFTLNPTSCEAMSVTGAATSTQGQPAPLTDRFQVGECGRLAFRPRLSLSLKGGTKRAKHPALTATLTQPAGQANIARASVALPHSEFLDQGHLNNICTRVQFAEGEGHGEHCPPGSVYGHAKAWSPLLERPLEGPVYLRSSSHKLPDLVAALKGPESQPIEVDLDGRVDSVNGGIRNTFEVVPDAPVSRFVLEMQGGRKGLIVNSENLCARAQYATAKLAAQNGRRYDFHPQVVAAGCMKAHGRHSRAAHGRRR